MLFEKAIRLASCEANPLLIVGQLAFELSDRGSGFDPGSLG